MKSFLFFFHISNKSNNSKKKQTNPKKNRPNVYRDRQAIGGLEITLRRRTKKEKCIQYCYYFLRSREREKEKKIFFFCFIHLIIIG